MKTYNATSSFLSRGGGKLLHTVLVAPDSEFYPCSTDS
jgi:hypothetical protein